jgi:L-lactate dehydrogenase complex protein LldF
VEIRSGEYPERARSILTDTPLVRDSVTDAALLFDRKRQESYAEIDADQWRRWAEGVKNHLLTHLDRYLEEAEQQLIGNGVTVHWAETVEDVHDILDGLVDQYGVRRLVKAKSMLTEELGVNPFLASKGVEFFETDLGEYIIQLFEEPPSHIVVPAMHRRLEEIRELFHQKLGTPPDADPDELAAAARRLLRDAFLSADMGMSGGNFLVAETGTLALIENEGNIRLTTSAPPVHVALVGIEKLLPRLSDLAGFLQLTARAALGMRIGTFVSLIQGPRRGSEPDGPEALHVILVDNGRSRVLADPEAWETLRCVRCAACLNTCPVYRQTGGHAYGWVYSGPIGSVLTPGMRGLEATWPLPYASTLCGACFDACPVRIPIPDLLLNWRQRAVESDLVPTVDSRFVRAYSRVMTHPRLYRWASRAIRLIPKALDNTLLPVLKAWTRSRSGLRPGRRTFRDMWKKGIQ